MLVRLLKLKESVDVYTKKECPHLALNDDEWGQIKYLIAILRPFAVYTSLIGASRLPTIHQVFDIYNRLLTHLENAEEMLEGKMRRWKVEMNKACRKAKGKIGVYYGATASSQAGKYYGMAILLDPRHKLDNWLRVEWAPTDEDPYDWQAYYWNELKELYDRDYAHLTPSTRRLELPTRLQPRAEFSLDVVMDQLNTAMDPMPSSRPEKDVVSEAAREFDEWRSWSKSLIPGSLLVVTNTL
jgi:hypothetical protein